VTTLRPRLAAPSLVARRREIEMGLAISVGGDPSAGDIRQRC
jgi:hypothetical protein